MLPRISIISYILMRSKQKQQRKPSHKNQQYSESILNRKIVSPQKLKILVLAGNELFSEHLQFLQKCINLIKLDISHNQITKLSERICFQNLTKLQVLQLHHNKLANIESIDPIFKCPILTYMTYHHNPMESHAKNEHIIINMIPSLKLVNNRIVYIQERSDFLMHERPMTFVDSELFQSWKSTENSQSYYLKVLNMQLQFIDNLWTFKNPIIFIQRAWRHFLPQRFNVSSKSSVSRSIKSKLTSRRQQNSKLQQRKQIKDHPLKTCFEQWKNFSQGIKGVRQSLAKVRQDGEFKDKTYLLQPLDVYFRLLRNMRVKEPILRMIKRIRRKIYEKKMINLFVTSLKMKHILFQSAFSFYHLSGISKTHRVFYNRNQQHLLDNFLAFISQKWNKRQVIYNKSIMHVNKQFSAIRLTDPQSFANKYSSKEKCYSIGCLLWASTKVVAINRKKTPGKFKAGIIGIRQLSYIKNRDKVISASDYKKSVQILRRLQKFAQNEYEQSMWYFQCKDDFVMKQLIRMIYYHNAKALKFDIKVKKSSMLSLLENYEEPFIFYAEDLLKRTCAAVAIQKTWRRYISNKNQKESIYFKMKKNRAALHIQYFYRKIVYKHRSYFTTKLFNDLSLVKTASIIYPLQLYLNINLIYNQMNRGKLFKNIKLTKKEKNFGVSQEFYRSIFHSIIRQKYFQNHKVGMQNYEEQIDIYNLIHFNAQIRLVSRNNQQFISFTYPSKAQAAIIASLVSLFTYQLWGKYYVFPLTRQNLQVWPSRIEEYRKVNNIKNIIKPYSESNEYSVKQIKETGVFLSKKQELFPVEIEALPVTVEFFQKRYHNFPLKHSEHLVYRFVNVNSDFFSVALTEGGITDEAKEEKLFKSQTNSNKLLRNAKNLKNIKDIRQSFDIGDTRKLKKETPFNVTMIQKSKFAFFDQSDKNLKPNQTVKPLQQISKTVFVIEQNKREKVSKFYKEQILKRQTQKGLKQSNLAALREKAKQQKTMNMTLKNMKDLQRTQHVRNKVNQVKQFKSRANSTKRQEQSQFIQQNNFVMEQQLKMIIMRNKMKDAQKRKQESLASHKMVTDKQSQVRTIQSRKSSKQKMKVDQQEINISNLQASVIGDEGSIVNTKKRVKKSRANSIGAYIRDPSFVHGVFPQEYYPIQNRATSFYFPPVV